MSDTQPNPFLKLVLEIGPLAVFFLSFQFGGEILDNTMAFSVVASMTGPEVLSSQSGPLFVATVFFIVAITASLMVSYLMTRSLPRMAALTAVVVLVFGGLTLWLQDETFIKMKPTIANGLFALILGAGLLQGRSYFKYLMGDALPMDDEGWMIFTRRWAMFFVFLALLNEVIWRTQSTEFWVGFKTFGNLPLTLGFMACQWPLLQRHMSEETPPD